jgi:transcription elongation GreA/GreB family factor
MSVAFVREESAALAAEVELPARPISLHPNIVTPAGLAALEKAMVEARAAYETAQQVEDVNERRRAGALALRDIAYLSERLSSAKIVARQPTPTIVAFGSCVAFKRSDGRRQVFSIVGEDEANPREASISYVSPIARALLGKAVGDLVAIGDDELEVLKIT